MSVVALATWILTAAGGLFLLSIWLIEYDRDFQRVAATRLPIPVISSHALLAISGLAFWVAYLIIDSDRLAWTALAIIGTGACLGLIMAIRWIGVYRAFASAKTRGGSNSPRAWSPIPPERNFPVPVVIAHGLFAVVTVTLVALTAAGVGGS